MAKLKYKIESDGTPEGTKLTVNGENITDDKRITNIWFNASGGVVWGPGDEMASRVSLEYRAISDDGEGTTTGESVSIDLNKSEEPVRKVIGEPSQFVSDALVGKESETITKILDYKDKVSSFIPEKEVLKTRSMASLKDTLSDLENEAKAGK